MLYGVNVTKDTMNVIESHSPTALFSELKCEAVFIGEPQAKAYAYDEATSRKLILNQKTILSVGG